MVQQINTSSISITNVVDNMRDNGLNLDVPIEDLHDPDIVEYTGSSTMGHTIKVHQVADFVAMHALNPDLWGHTLCLLGPTAIGKTEGVRQGLQQAAQTMNRTLNLTELHVSQMGPVDALGVPREENKQTYWAPPKIWPLASTQEELHQHQTKVQRFLDAYTKQGALAYDLLPENWFVHFHDEVTNPSSPQVPHQLFPAWCGDNDGRMIGGHRLVRDYFVVLAGNRVEDGTNSINLAASAVTRLSLVEVIPHFLGWLKNYAFKPRMIAGKEMACIHPLVITYLYKHSKDFAPQDQSERSPMDPFPTPRAWKFISDLLYANDLNPIPVDLLRAAIAGRLGAATTQQFFSFIKHYGELPDVDKLMRGEPIHNFPAKSRMDLLSILGTNMILKLNEHNAHIFMQYMLDDTKFSPEMAAMVMKQLRPANKLSPLVRIWAPLQFASFVDKHRQFVF